jgi:hypothetical protein
LLKFGGLSTENYFFGILVHQGHSSGETHVVTYEVLDHAIPLDHGVAMDVINP